MRADQAEIAALKKEVAQLRVERDILKTAAAFFVLSTDQHSAGTALPGIASLFSACQIQ